MQAAGSKKDLKQGLQLWATESAVYTHCDLEVAFWFSPGSLIFV